jgi:hypothetical protein
MQKKQQSQEQQRPGQPARASPPAAEVRHDGNAGNAAPGHNEAQGIASGARQGGMATVPVDLTGDGSGEDVDEDPGSASSWTD